MDHHLAFAAVVFALGAGFSGTLQAATPGGDPARDARDDPAWAAEEQITGMVEANGVRHILPSLPSPLKRRSPRTALPESRGELRPRAGGGQ